MFLGIDLGTSSVKALLVDGEERAVAEASVALAVQRPHPGWSEQDPAGWWAAACAAIDQIKAAAPAALAAVAGIGLSGQMHGAVLLDAAHRVLRPAILWNDGRAAAECAALEAAFPQLRDVTGNIAMPGFTAPKLLWVRAHEPDIFARDRPRAAAEGVSALPPHRRGRGGHVGRVRHALARRGAARLVGCARSPPRA